jgi:hypothetical protein
MNVKEVIAFLAGTIAGMWILIIAVFLLTLASCLPKDGGWSAASEAHPQPEVPLQVCSMVYGSVDDMLGAAMDAWNSAVGCKLFVRGDRCDVLAERSASWTNSATGGRVDGEAWYDATSDSYRIALNTPGTTTWMYLIWMHELGHVLGLGHDRWRMSVMRSGSHMPLRRGDVDRGPPWPIVSHQDRGLVRGRYCR